MTIRCIKHLAFFTVIPMAMSGLTAAAETQEAARQAFTQAHPGVTLQVSGPRVTQISGPAFAFGADPVAAANEFRQTHANLFGVRPVDFEPGSALIASEPHTLPLMYDAAAGTYKFTLVCYKQVRDGVPVFRGELRVLVRNEPNAPVVLAASSLRAIGEFTPNLRAAVLGEDQLKQIAQKLIPTLNTFSQPRQVIWAGYEALEAAPTLAFEFVGHSGDQTSPAGYQERLFVIDAANGAILFHEDQVLTEDVSGNVSGQTTDLPGAAECFNENSAPMPYASVNIQGQGTFYTDVNGNYTLPNAGTDPVIVESRLTGRRFVISDQAGAPPVLSQGVTPPGPADFVHNSANSSEFVRASVNSYINANRVRDMVVAANPSYPTIGTQINMGVNTNINQNCNAFYSPAGQTLNFYRAGGGCNNTGFGDVVHHEYGHHVVQMGGSGQGQYGEGMGDCLGILVTDQSELGVGFQSCATGIRTANNTMQYPCSGEIHFCGQLISGCVWDTRNLLQASEPVNYLSIIRSLTVNSVPLHTGTEIAPSIYTTFITLDDDDANLANGTPHCYEITRGFALHSMSTGALSVTAFQYPSGRPATVLSNTPTTVPVNVVPGTCPAVIDNTGKLYYRIGTSGPFTQVAMNHLGANQYEAVLPAAECLSTIQYYVSVDRVPSGVIYDPAIPASAVHSAFVVDGFNTVADYDFESNPGWAVSGTVADGPWDANPGVPVNCARGDPPADYDGSGQCWLTDNSAANACNSDVDGGSTTLTSQVIDISALADPQVSYARWYSNTFGADPQNDIFTVEVSDNGGSSWSPLEIVGPTTGSLNPEVSGGWVVKSYRIADFVSVTSQFRIRFVASDLNSGSVIEAGIDAFKIFDYICPPPCPGATGDINDDTMADGSDIQRFVDAMMGTATPDEVCAGDFNENQQLDTGDIDGFAAVLVGP